MKEIIINHFLNYEFMYIFLFCSLIFLFVSIFVKKEIIKKISMFLFAIFFILSCFELVLSFFMTLNIKYYTAYIDNLCDISISSHRHVRLLLSNDEIYEEWNDIIHFDKTVFDKFDNFKLIFDKKYSLYGNDFRITKCSNVS